MSPAVGVCGFGRCGSTMVMAMLDAGGVPPVEGTEAVSYELPRVELAYQMALEQLAGRAVKLLDSVLQLGAPNAGSWRFVWLDRDPVEQAKSLVKFLSTIVGLDLTEHGDTEEQHVEWFVESFRRDRPVALSLLRRRAPVVVLRYEDILANPRRGARYLRSFCPTLDVEAAAAAVHDRDGACRGDLLFEATGMAP